MRTLVLLALLLLCACSGSDKEPLLPLPQPPKQLTDATLRQNLLSYFQSAGAPQNSRYQYHRTDLDFDSRTDALVLMQAPYGYWCDTGGCKMLVLKAADTNFQIINAIEPIREPIFLSDRQTNGWRDIVVRVSGREAKAKKVVLQFNGAHYPNTPLHLNNRPLYPKESLERIFNREGAD